MSLYLITFNNIQNVDLTMIHEVIKNNSTISDWWHYLPNTYLIETSSTSKQLADLISLKFQGLLFFIVKIDLNDVNGVLAKDAWDWINKKKSVKLKLMNRSTLPSPTSGYLPPIKNVYPKTGNRLLDAILSGDYKP